MPFSDASGTTCRFSCLDCTLQKQSHDKLEVLRESGAASCTIFHEGKGVGSGEEGGGGGGRCPGGRREGGGRKRP